MATVIIAVIVFGLVGVDVVYLVWNLAHHTGKFGCSDCSGCTGCTSGCSGSCSECSFDCGKDGGKQEMEKNG